MVNPIILAPIGSLGIINFLARSSVYHAPLVPISYLPDLNQSKGHHHLFQYIQICTVEAFYQFPLIQLPHSHQNYHPYQQNHKEHSFEYGQL